MDVLHSYFCIPCYAPLFRPFHEFVRAVESSFRITYTIQCPRIIIEEYIVEEKHFDALLKSQYTLHLYQIILISNVWCNDESYGYYRDAGLKRSSERYFRVTCNMHPVHLNPFAAVTTKLLFVDTDGSPVRTDRPTYRRPVASAGLAFGFSVASASLLLVSRSPRCVSLVLSSSLVLPRPIPPVSSRQMTRGRATLFAEGHVAAAGRGLPTERERTLLRQS